MMTFAFSSLEKYTISSWVIAVSNFNCSKKN
nr:MAG TPA_asm: hypothetical protein [Caudoviricetes sp.]